MPINNKEIWIKKGYEIFAISGQSGLKIEPLSKTVGKSKSSFYHHFADLEFFTEHLLKHHIGGHAKLPELGLELFDGHLGLKVFR